MTGHRSAACAALAVLLCFALVAGGCGKKEEPLPPALSYGVADLETLVKTHPRYSEYFKLETEYNRLVGQYQNEQRQLIQKASLAEASRAAIADTSARIQAENEFQTKVKAKEAELNAGLKALYDTIQKNHDASESYDSSGLSEEERVRMANLQMKLTVLGVSGEEKETIKSELHELLSRRMNEAGGAMTSWTEAERNRMKGARDQASAQLEAYAASVASEMKAHQEKTAKAADTVHDLWPDRDRWESAWQTRFKKKQDEMAALKKAIMTDIENEAGLVASEQQLKMIFSRYRANVRAKDVTGDIAGKLARMK